MYEVHVPGRGIVNSNDSLVEIVKYCSVLVNRLLSFDIVYKETGEAIVCVSAGETYYDNLHEHWRNLHKKPDVPDVCNCDFSRGNFSCTCGAGRREIEASKKISRLPKIPLEIKNISKGLIMKDAQDDVPF